MQNQSLIKAFQKTLLSFNPSMGESYSSDFAITRFHKKFEEPNGQRETYLKQCAWRQWIVFDKNLPKSESHFFRAFQKNPKLWFAIRESIRKNVQPIGLKGDVNFSPGSVFTPTRGHNSVEAKLASAAWDCTHDNFDNFAKVCYANNALKKAARARWRRYLIANGLKEWKFNSLCKYDPDLRFGEPGYGFRVFSRKLSHVVQFVYGSRFTSIPKNNAVRRPINVEPFCNVVVQKLIGASIRNQILSVFGIDLDTLSVTQQKRIADSRMATIDLKNASDSISIELCRFLLPQHVFRMLMVARSEMILSPDDKFIAINKISAMGNGFTFELMTLLLTFISRSLDETATVFGDDIIIGKEHAYKLIELLTDVGFVVNKEKSFIDGPFRESCGGNYHDTEGYIESYDFTYPESIHDCIIIYNKVKRLSFKYEAFQPLERSLRRFIPNALRGPSSDLHFDYVKDYRSITWEERDTHPLNLGDYFRVGSYGSNKRNGDQRTSVPKKIQSLVKRKLDELCLGPNFRFFYGVKAVLEERSSCRKDLTRRHWAKYLMYLRAGRRSKDIVTGRVSWVDLLYVETDERAFRLSSLIKP